EAAVPRLERDAGQRPQLARRARDALAGVQIEAAVVAVAGELLPHARPAPLVRHRAGQVGALLQERDQLAALAPDEDRRRPLVGIVEDAPLAGGELIGGAELEARLGL